jgi:predicted ArsR family transcriptional regulator
MVWNKLVMQHTRQQIIKYLHSHRSATSTELGRALLVTPANIRHHLKLLEKDDLVKVIGHEAAHGRGRPTNLYGLTDHALTHNLDGLSDALLGTLFSCELPTKVIVNRVARNLIGTYKPASTRLTLMKRVVEKLNQLKYEAAWEASPNGPKIIFRNCPYALIISEHPEICDIDTAMLTYALKRPFIQSAKLERSPDGSSHCAFVLQSDEL